jgi:glutathione S-transferase
MATYKLDCNGGSGNSYKLALYLNCAGLDWQPIGVDFAGGQTRDPDWRAGTNTMGEVPVLEVNGQRMSQSGAILIWLAETTGKFAPAPSSVSRPCDGSCSTITSSRIIMRCIGFKSR